MARFDVYLLKDDDRFVVDLQAAFLDGLGQRVVAPLFSREEAFQPLSRLNPSVILQGKSYILAIHLLAAVPVNQLGEKIGNVSQYRDEIVAATDFLFQGF